MTTKEEIIQRMINSTFNLITEFNRIIELSEKTPIEQKLIDDTQHHLRIILNRSDIVATLTVDQLSQINTIVNPS